MTFELKIRSFAFCVEAEQTCVRYICNGLRDTIRIGERIKNSKYKPSEKAAVTLSFDDLP